MTKFKLYHRETGYKCKVNTQEILFLFGIDSDDLETINNYLINNQTGYYITA